MLFGCSQPAPENLSIDQPAEKITLKPVELSEEEISFNNLDTNKFVQGYSFESNDKIRYYQLTAYRYKNGKWTQISANSEKSA